jgi:hypothetical protein
MEKKSTNNNKQAHDLLEEIFYLWSDISKDENGDEIRMPASEEEARKSRDILYEISQMDIADELVIQRYDQLNEIIVNYEETLTYLKSPNGQADKLLDKMFNLWSNVSKEDDIEYHRPANDEEIEQSWALISEIEEINFDNEEIKERLKEYREVLKSYETANTDKEDENQLAMEKLEEIYSTWSNISVEDDKEYRSPDNRKEIKASRTLIREIKLLEVTDQQVQDRIEELESVLDSVDAAIPNYTGKIIRSIVFSLAIIAVFLYMFNFNTYNSPEFEYEKDWFVTEKGGYLRWKAFISDKELPEVKQKIYLKSGTELKPIAEIGNWLQVETSDGQRGLVKYTLLKGSRYVSANANAKVFFKIGSNEKDAIAPGTKARVLERTKREGRFGEELYLKIKLEDGSVKWANDYDFHNLIYNNIPEINQLYNYHTNISMIQKNMIGKSLSEIESQYGTASSVLKVNGKHQAYFRYLIVVDQKKHHEGILVNLDDNDVAKNIEYTDEGQTRYFDHFPLVNTMRNLEIDKKTGFEFYKNEGIQFQWWENFMDMNWFTMIIGWIVKIIILLIVIFLIFSIPRLFVSPIMQLFAFTRFFGNGMVKLINSLIYLAATYLFFVLMIIIMDQWLIPAIGSVLVFVLWWKRHISNISYNRCPYCHTMYSALDEGSTYKGQTENVTWGTYDVYKGSSTHYSGDTKITTSNYDRRDKKTTEIIDHYLDHRMCARCSYQWDVDRDEKEKYTEHL